MGSNSSERQVMRCVQCAAGAVVYKRQSQGGL